MLNPAIMNKKIQNAKHVAAATVQRHPLATAGALTATVAIAATLGASGAIVPPLSMPQSSVAYADASEVVPESDHHYPKFELSKVDYTKFGYETPAAYYEKVQQNRDEADGAADALIEALGEYMDDDQKAIALRTQATMTTTASLGEYDKAKAEFEEVAAAAEAKYDAAIAARARHYGGGGSAYVQNGGGLTRSGGVNWFNGHRETWYSQRELPGGGLNIPGRHVRSDGVICDGDGYVVVASPNRSDRVNGAIIDTSLGQGKAYDFCPGGSYDIYTDW